MPPVVREKNRKCDVHLRNFEKSDSIKMKNPKSTKNIDLTSAVSRALRTSKNVAAIINYY